MKEEDCSEVMIQVKEVLEKLTGGLKEIFYQLEGMVPIDQAKIVEEHYEHL